MPESVQPLGGAVFDVDGPVPGWNDHTDGLGSWTGFIIDDVDSVYEQLVAAGVELAPPRTRDHSVREITVEDPEGHSRGFVRRSLTHDPTIQFELSA